MSIESVRKFLKTYNKDGDIIECETSSATSEMAADILGVPLGMIAKSMLFKFPKDGGHVMIVTSGDTKIDNRKFKSYFNVKPSICPSDEMVELTGHTLGGNCPFALKNLIDVYIDESLKRFDYVYPACGSHNSVIKLSLSELYELSNPKGWIDACKPRE